MPLMMQEAMDIDMNEINDIDDLFNDGSLPLPPRPPPKELFQRIDELRGSGCCQGVAWSRLGSIASFTPNGRTIEFRNLRCHPVDGSWDLSEATSSHRHPDAIPYQHLIWSPNGIDLAAIDAAGRISIFNSNLFLNAANMIRDGAVDPADDLNAVVGAYWLNLMPPQMRPLTVSSLAVNTERGHRYENAQSTLHGPCNPIPQNSALLCLTTNGVLRLLWQKADKKWFETNHEVESILSSNDLITHASFCVDKNQSLLIVFATSKQQLRVVRLMINWKTEAEKPPPGATPNVTPVMKVSHVAIGNWMDGSAAEVDTYHQQSSMATISHLSIISPCAENVVGPASLPTILTVRSHLPAVTSAFPSAVHSTIDRWELYGCSQSIHPAFEQMGSRKKGGGSQPSSAVALRKLDGCAVDKVVVNVQVINMDRIVCFAYSDGSFDYRDRITLQELYTIGSLDKIMHVSQIGFSHSGDVPCLQAVLSPTGCSIVQLNLDGKLMWRELRHPLDEIETPVEDEQCNAIMAGMALSLTAAVMMNVNYDDVLIVAHRYSSYKGFTLSFMKDVARILSLMIDHSDDNSHEQLVRNPAVQISYTVLNSLGYDGDTRSRTFSARLAWTGLQIRNCMMLMHMIQSLKFPDPNHPNNPNKKIAGLEDPDIMRLISGSVRWSLDIMNYLIDSLLHPDDRHLFSILSDPNIQHLSHEDLASLQQRLESSNNIALHLLLSSVSRGFLSAICRRLTHFDWTARKAIQDSHQTPGVIAPELRGVYIAIATATRDSIVQIKHFEAFLLSISSSVKEAYIAGGMASAPPQPGQGGQPPKFPGSPQRNQCELMMLFGAPLPAVLGPAMQHVFRSLLPAVKAGIDEARLFFWDAGGLGLDPVGGKKNGAVDRMVFDDDGKDGDDASGSLATDGRKQRRQQKLLAHNLPTIDCLRRVPVNLRSSDAGIVAASGERPTFRRCARCSAVMENVSSRKVSFILLHQQRRCLCGGHWDVLREGQVVA